jgi:uncharacterized protein with PIN domain
MPKVDGAEITRYTGNKEIMRCNACNRIFVSDKIVSRKVPGGDWHPWWLCPECYGKGTPTELHNAVNKAKQRGHW